MTSEAYTRIAFEQLVSVGGLSEISSELHTQAIAVRTGTGLTTNVLAVIPPDARRLVTVQSGAGHSFVRDIPWLAEILRAHSGVIYIEPYGHSPASSAYSYSHPETRSTQAMSEALGRVYGGGLIPLFASKPELRRLPIHQLGLSMGGGTLVSAHLEGANSVALDDAVARRISSTALISPRLRLGKNYSWVVRKVVAPVLRFLLWASRGNLEKVVKIPWPVRPRGIGRGSDEAFRLQEAMRDGLRPQSIPLAYGTDVFRHDEMVADRIPGRMIGTLGRTLLALYDGDQEIDPSAVQPLCLHLGGARLTQMDIDAHNPFESSDMPHVIGGIHAFFDQPDA